MSKVIPIKDIGIPVPTTAPPTTDSIACYFGAQGFTPSYTQANRVVLPISALSVTQVTAAPVSGQPAPVAVPYYDFPVSTILPTTSPAGPTDFYFTLVDANGSESDFSPVVTETVDRTPPPILGQPIVLH